MAAVSAVAPHIASPLASSFDRFYNNWELQIKDYKYRVRSIFTVTAQSQGYKIANECTKNTALDLTRPHQTWAFRRFYSISPEEYNFN